MKTMTIKISKWFYFSLLFPIPILLLFGLLLICLFFFGKNEKEFRDYFFLFFGLGICVMTIRGVIQYLNNAHKVIEIDEEKIRFGKEIFYWTELDYMVLTGKQSFKFIIDIPTEASTFYFKNGQIRYIFDGVYENTQNIKIFLEQVVYKKTISKPYFSNVDIENINFDTFKNNPLTSFYGILLLIALASLLLLLVYIPQYLSISFFLIFFLICVFIFISASTMHYFQVSKEYFVVKHHCFFWKTKIYQMNNIKEILFETPSSRSPNFVRIIQNNYQNELYSAGTLDDKTLLALKKRLEFYKIKVQDDLIYKL
jgi:hypothetical protein